MTFDLKEHLGKIRDGRSELEQRKVEVNERLDWLASEREGCEESLRKIEDQIIAIDELGLDKIIGPAPSRMSGVRQLVEEIAVKLVEGAAHGVVAEEVIFKAVLARQPGTKESSIRSSLTRLVEKGVFARSGKRGARIYGHPSAESGPPPPSEENAAPVKPDDEAREQVLKALAEPSGKNRNELAWLVGDATVLDAILAEPEVEPFVSRADGVDETRYRIKEGALGSLPLFDQAEHPPAHANKD